MDRTKRLSRRNFLLTAGAGGAAAAATALTLRNSSPSTSKPDSGNKRAAQGYQLSEHVNNYYRTTKV